MNIEQAIEVGVPTNIIEHVDHNLYTLIQAESDKQCAEISFVPEQNVVAPHISECLSSVLSNCYSEGRPGKRYYGGCDNIDMIESLCEKRALEAFNIVDTHEVNVQSHSRSSANAAVILGLLHIGDRILTWDLMSKGHPSLGVSENNLSEWSKERARLYDIYSYQHNENMELDMMMIGEQAKRICPKLIVVSCPLPQQVNFKEFRKIADSVDAKLLVDISDVVGLVAAGVYDSPFQFADAVTTSTDKTLCGPRGALVFMNKELLEEHWIASIHRGIFPGFQGGPHNANIAGIAAALKDVKSGEFRAYIGTTMKNKQIIEKCLKERQFCIVSGESHTIFVNIGEGTCERLSKVENIAVGQYKDGWIRISASYLSRVNQICPRNVEFIDYIRTLISKLEELM